MGMATHHHTGRSRARLSALPGMAHACPSESRVEIVENPPRVDGDGDTPPWRWWSPLLETAQDFRESLEEGLRIRRHRLAMATGR